MTDDPTPYRALMCGVILQAVEDFMNETEYKSTQKRSEIQEARASALHFLRSPAFERMCLLLHLPADKIKTELFK